MFLGIPTFVWIVACVILIGVVVVLLGWYVWYCVFDWGVHYVKHVWKDEDEQRAVLADYEEDKRGGYMRDEEYEQWKKWVEGMEARREGTR